MSSRRSAEELGGFERRLLDELMQMIAEPEQAYALPPAHYESPRRRGTVTRRGPGRIRVALTASFAAAAVAAVAVAVGLAGHDATGQTQPPPEISASPGFPAADQAFYQVVHVGGLLSTAPGIHWRCELIWYYTPLTGRYFRSFAQPCSANPHRLFPGWAVPTSGGHGFPALPNLSDRPATLLGQISRAADRGAQYWGTDTTGIGDDALSDVRLTTHAAVMFTLVERLLEMPVPQGLRSALYQVAGRISGARIPVRVPESAAHPAGLAFLLLIASSRSTVDFAWFVLSPGRHEFLGLGYVQRTRDGHWYSMTVLRTGLVREN